MTLSAASRTTSGSPVASTMALTSRWPHSGLTSSEPPESRLTTPPGTSDTPATSPRSSARSGQRSETTATTTLPAASGGAISGTSPSTSGSSGASTATTPVGSGNEKLKYGAATGLMPPITACSLSVQPA